MASFQPRGQSAASMRSSAVAGSCEYRGRAVFLSQTITLNNLVS